jgi:hypothetical protein
MRLKWKLGIENLKNSMNNYSNLSFCGELLVNKRKARWRDVKKSSFGHSKWVEKEEKS